MAFIPILFRDGRVGALGKHPRWYGNRSEPLERRDMFPDEFLMLVDSNPRRFGRKRCCSDSGICNNNNENEQQIVNKKPKDAFHVDVNVLQFKAKEISVKAKDKCIIVEGKGNGQEDNDNAYILKHFVHKYQLPDTVDDGRISSSLSTDGVLTVSAPKSESANLRTKPVIREADSSESTEGSLENSEE